MWEMWVWSPLRKLAPTCCRAAEPAPQPERNPWATGKIPCATAQTRCSQINTKEKTQTKRWCWLPSEWQLVVWSSPFLDIFKSGANWCCRCGEWEEEMSQRWCQGFPYEQLKKGGVPFAQMKGCGRYAWWAEKEFTLGMSSLSCL